MKTITTFLSVCACLILTGCGGGASKPAATADAAVMQAVSSMQDNDPSAAWDMLPASYQEQANGLMHEFAGKIPADLYDSSANLLVKLEKVLSSKKDLILANPQLKSVPVDVSKNYDDAVAMLGILTSSDLMSAEKMKSADIGKMMSTTGAKLMKKASEVEIDDSVKTDDMSDMLEMQAKLASVKAELVSEEGDTAVVKITAKDEDPEEIDFVRIEGKWIPKDLAEGWSEMITEAKAGIAEINITPEQAAQANMMIGMVNGLLDQIQAAKTQEELMQAVGGAMGMMMGGMM
jgi:hypothetical protein